ncbi:large ribosomal subunit protein uL23m [Cylas formicarius]|uniref:large ribosomal subunit protein uL23m n=1 Tax=Cylas formicarius TaxID=197179 RepID=UPI002958D938|nr:large ribosomal subunit protein uL23m [Cylas formicarius]
MSTRWYPIYQKGGPQLRVFLPNFWMKLVRPTENQPPNVVQFACSMEMTKHDIKNYLENIYNVKTVHVRTRIALGKTKKCLGRQYIIKDDDIKYAYITMPKEESFKFPDLFPEEIQAENNQMKALKEVKEGTKQFLENNKHRPGIPGWLTI